MRAAGGEMINSHAPIGVAVAQSRDTDFPAKLMRLDSNVISVGIETPERLCRYRCSTVSLAEVWSTI